MEANGASSTRRNGLRTYLAAAPKSSTAEDRNTSRKLSILFGPMCAKLLPIYYWWNTPFLEVLWRMWKGIELAPFPEILRP